MTYFFVILNNMKNLFTNALCIQILRLHSE